MYLEQRIISDPDFQEWQIGELIRFFCVIPQRLWSQHEQMWAKMFLGAHKIIRMGSIGMFCNQKYLLSKNCSTQSQCQVQDMTKYGQRYRC